jgi:hypothetical protein
MLLHHFTKAWREIEAAGMIEARWPETLDGPFTTRFVHLSRSDSVDSLAGGDTPGGEKADHGRDSRR